MGPGSAAHHSASRMFPTCGNFLRTGTREHPSSSVLRCARDTMEHCQGSSDPAAQLAQCEVAQQRHPGFAGVEAGDRGEIFPAVVTEDLGILAGDLLERLQA